MCESVCMHVLLLCLSYMSRTLNWQHSTSNTTSPSHWPCCLFTATHALDTQRTWLRLLSQHPTPCQRTGNYAKGMHNNHQTFQLPTLVIIQDGGNTSGLLNCNVRLCLPTAGTPAAPTAQLANATAKKTLNW